MKWFARLLVFGVALSVGVLAATVWWAFILSADSDRHLISCAMPLAPPAETGLKVTFEGFDRSEYLLRFRIYNGLDRPVKYLAHSPSAPFPRFKFNGAVPQHTFTCGTGIQTFYISPGTSAEVTVSRYDFGELPKKGDMINVGYYLDATPYDKFEIYYADGFLVPEEFVEFLSRR